MRPVLAWCRGHHDQDDRIRTLLDDNRLRTYGEFGTMRIVLTNDDGIEAPGLLAARRAMEKVGDVITVAPDQNRSGVGRSISFGRSLDDDEREVAAGVIG